MITEKQQEPLFLPFILAIFSLDIIKIFLGGRVWDSMQRTLLCQSKSRTEVEDGEKWHPKGTRVGTDAQPANPLRRRHPWMRPLTLTPISEAEPIGLIAAILAWLGPGPGNAGKTQPFVLFKKQSQLYFQQLSTIILWRNKAYFLPRTQRQRPRKTLISCLINCCFSAL